ncbi:MAG: hydrogenase subunit MbhD domain-containing protein [Nannocystaceae bacterium]
MSAVLILDVILLVLVLVAAVAVVQLRSLFSATIIAGVYSLLMALVWSNMHALDVAFTEAAVGAGISTVLLLGTLVHTGRIAKGGEKLHMPALLVCLLTGGALIYGTFDMPRFGDPKAPIHNLRVPKMLAQNVGKVPGTLPKATPEHRADAAHDNEPAHSSTPAHAHPSDDFGGHSPNTVTSLLAAYRGFDTMFETAVIFTAGVGLVLLLRRRREDPPGTISTGDRPPPQDHHATKGDT